jgi:hypothetical protein
LVADHEHAGDHQCGDDGDRQSLPARPHHGRTT